MRRATAVSAPAMFGRLPDQRDYVRWRVSANEAQVWQAWLNQQTWLGQGRHIVLPEGTDAAKAGANNGWMHLSPREKRRCRSTTHCRGVLCYHRGFSPLAGVMNG